MSLLFPKAAFKTDGGIWFTSGLFSEVSTLRKENVIFTLKGEDIDGLSSFPKLYLSLTEKDPTEYTMAMTVFGSWEHWVEITKSTKMRPVIKKLREEASVRQKSKAMEYMINEVETTGKNSFAAAKLLLAKPWEDKPTTPAKRKEAKEQNAVEDRKLANAFSEDAKRLGLNIVK